MTEPVLAPGPRNANRSRIDRPGRGPRRAALPRILHRQETELLRLATTGLISGKTCFGKKSWRHGNKRSGHFSGKYLQHMAPVRSDVFRNRPRSRYYGPALIGV